MGIVRHQRRVPRPLPADRLQVVEAAILAGDEEGIKRAIASAKEHWAEHGRYLAPHEVEDVAEQDRGAGDRRLAELHGALSPGTVQTVKSSTVSRVERLRAEYSVVEDT